MPKKTTIENFCKLLENGIEYARQEIYEIAKTNNLVVPKQFWDECKVGRGRWGTEQEVDKPTVVEIATTPTVTESVQFEVTNTNDVAEKQDNKEIDIKDRFASKVKITGALKQICVKDFQKMKTKCVIVAINKNDDVFIEDLKQQLENE